MIVDGGENAMEIVRGMAGRMNKRGEEGLKACHWNLDVGLWKTKMKR